MWLGIRQKIIGPSIMRAFVLHVKCVLSGHPREKKRGTRHSSYIQSVALLLDLMRRVTAGFSLTQKKTAFCFHFLHLKVKWYFAQSWKLFVRDGTDASQTGNTEGRYPPFLVFDCIHWSLTSKRDGKQNPQTLQNETCGVFFLFFSLLVCWL